MIPTASENLAFDLSQEGVELQHLGTDPVGEEARLPAGGFGVASGETVVMKASTTAGLTSRRVRARCA